MKQIGIDLDSFIKNGTLEFSAARPSLFGLEMHLITIHEKIKAFKPDIVIIDPISNLISVGGIHEVRGMLTRLIDFLKVNGITALFTALTIPSGNSLELTEEGISSLIDTWFMVRDVEGKGERNRGVFIIKSRGMQHSNKVREFMITTEGIDILDVNIGPAGILTGSARLAYQLEMENTEKTVKHLNDKKMRELERKRKVLESTIADLRTEFEFIEDELKYVSEERAKKTI